MFMNKTMLLSLAPTVLMNVQHLKHVEKPLQDNMMICERGDEDSVTYTKLH
jgi:hypothetical protein